MSKLLALTIWQPWAQLCVTPRPTELLRGETCRSPLCSSAEECATHGCTGGSPGMVKTIETRSWPAPASAIGQRIAIHASALDPDSAKARRMPGYRESLNAIPHGDPLPTGAVIGSAVLADCVPMYGREVKTLICESHVAIDRGFGPLALATDKWTDISDQLPYGGYAPGRWAWILTDAAPTSVRCPACWGEGLAWRDHPADGHLVHGRCLRCNGAGRCDPIPARGFQKLWRWEP